MPEWLLSYMCVIAFQLLWWMPFAYYGGSLLGEERSDISYVEEVDEMCL